MDPKYPKLSLTSFAQLKSPDATPQSSGRSGKLSRRAASNNYFKVCAPGLQDKLVTFDDTDKGAAAVAFSVAYGMMADLGSNATVCLYRPVRATSEYDYIDLVGHRSAGEILGDAATSESPDEVDAYREELAMLGEKYADVGRVLP